MVKTEELDKTDNSMIFIERDTALNKEEIYKKIKVASSKIEEFIMEKIKHKDDISVCIFLRIKV